MAAFGEEEIFNVARRIDQPDARRTYLDQVCGTDAGLRARVEILLRAHDGAKSFLAQPAGPPLAAPEPSHPATQGATTAPHEPAVETAGQTIGVYKLLEVIGEGGMGTVWTAEQTEPVRRKVALKVVKPGMDSKQVLARFEAERQALALM